MFSKFNHLHGIQEAGNNNKKLFNVVLDIIGKNKDNPMPPEKPDKELADDFLFFYLQD